MHLRRSSLSRRARPPLALALVGGVMAAVIATGHPVAAVGSGAAASTASVFGERTPVTPTGSAALADGTQVRQALGALGVGVPDSRRAARASRSAPRTPLHPNRPAHIWVRPNSGPLTSPFGYRWGRLHAGIDLAGPYGSPILAATDGCITYAGPESGYGEVMKITDWDGTETVYGHMSAFVRTSGCVKAGQVIARVGAAGDATGAHLHFEVHISGAPVNPISFLAKRHLYI